MLHSKHVSDAASLVDLKLCDDEAVVDKQALHQGVGWATAHRT
jgi:hypothetical protein